ncbi:MAG TPA: PAS domain S-box protein [Helicobacteraceae bacterium]|nr:PAS domain S-box protein [Helicobacteraceae bacterium]
MNTKPYETEIPQNQLILSRTDQNGIITYANETFAQISGYQVKELLGKPHNIVRHPDMPRSTFKQMWETLQSGKPWKGYVKNRRKDGGYYWVNAKIEPLYEHGQLIGYKSMRSYVPPEKRQEMERTYCKISLAEQGIVQLKICLEKDTWRKLRDYMQSKGITYEEAIKELIEKA